MNKSLLTFKEFQISLNEDYTPGSDQPAKVANTNPPVKETKPAEPAKKDNKGPDQREINKKLKHAPGFDKFPCVMSLPGYDLDKDGVIEVFGMDVQYFPDGTYSFNGKKGTYSCNGDTIEKKDIVQKGYNQKFEPYKDPKNPFITTGANKDYIKKGSKDPAGASFIKNLQKKLYDLKYLKSDKFLTGNLGDYTMKAVEDLCGKYNASLVSPIGVTKEVYDKIMNGKLK